jgi:hypothetical protein
VASGRKLTSDLLDEQAALLDRTIGLVKNLREVAGEGMNVLQHEYHCLRMVRVLKAVVPGAERVDWYWHPAQGSNVDEADVVGYLRGKALVQAEVTTSARPMGTITKRMDMKMKSLARLPGKHKYYGVVSEPMRKLAQTKAEPFGITVVLLETGPSRIIPGTINNY